MYILSNFFVFTNIPSMCFKTKQIFSFSSIFFSVSLCLSVCVAKVPNPRPTFNQKSKSKLKNIIKTKTITRFTSLNKYSNYSI